MIQYLVRLTPYTEQVKINANNEKEALEKAQKDPKANRFLKGFEYLNDIKIKNAKGKKMNINQEQKDLLIGILEHTLVELDMSDSMEYGEDVKILISKAKDIEVKQ